MRTLLLVCCLFGAINLSSAQKNINISVEVKDDDHGTQSVVTTTTVDGEVKKVDDQNNVEDDNVNNTINKSVDDALEFIGVKKKDAKGVMAGPDGQGDVVIGQLPGKGKYPPIILTTGTGGRQEPTFPEGSIVLEYKNFKDMQANYRNDLNQAIDQMLK